MHVLLLDRHELLVCRLTIPRRSSRLSRSRLGLWLALWGWLSRHPLKRLRINHPLYPHRLLHQLLLLRCHRDGTLDGALWMVSRMRLSLSLHGLLRRHGPYHWSRLSTRLTLSLSPVRRSHSLLMRRLHDRVRMLDEMR